MGKKIGRVEKNNLLAILRRAVLWSTEARIFSKKGLALMIRGQVFICFSPWIDFIIQWYGPIVVVDQRDVQPRCQD